jgi:hypothetical protein
MSDQKAKDIIALRDRELSRQSNFRALWQSVADLEFPQTTGIATSRAAGEELMSGLFDTTAVEELENMTSGITNNLFPAGQRFFAFKPPTDMKDDQDARDYLYYLTEETHEHIFNSNYIAQTSNTIKYWAGFGTGANYSDWTVADGLNFRDYAIGTYQCLENSKGIVDTIILTCPMSARQINQDWPGRGGPAVEQALSRPDTANEEINVVWCIRPRADRDPQRIDSRNMAWESTYVLEKDEIVLDEGGYDEFPFAVPRYEVIYREVYGRGRGVTLLPQVRVLNRLARDYQEMSNKWVNPPKEVLESFEGQVDVTPGALNYVQQMNSIAPINMGANGMFPVTKDILEYHREVIRQGFFKNAFEALGGLSGDRRTTTEIIERLKEGMKKLSRPLGRLFIELLTPQITRSALLLIRNGVVARPPESLHGQMMKVRLINPLALALEDQQARGGQYWVSAVGEAEALFPGVKDNVDSDEWARDLGESLGVKGSHIRPARKRDEIRRQRAEQMAAQQQLETAAMAADAYGKTTRAPEPGSMAEQGE